MKKVKHNRNLMRRSLLVTSIFLLFIGVGLRAMNTYDGYRAHKLEEKHIIEDKNQNKKEFIKSILEQSNEIAVYSTKSQAIELQSKLLEQYSKDEVYNSLINKEFYPDMFDIFKNVFDLSEVEGKSVVTIGTKDSVIFNSSNVNHNKFKYIETNGKKYATWDEFYKNMDNPKVTKQAFTDLVLKKKGAVILRLDGQYNNNIYYSIDDVVKDYMENGMENMDQYVILTKGLITEDGDMFGEKDVNYVEANDDVNKLFIFQSLSVDTFLKHYVPIIHDIELGYERSIYEFSNRMNLEFTQTILTMAIILIAIIILMIIYKNILEEDTSIEKEIKELNTLEDKISEKDKEFKNSKVE